LVPIKGLLHLFQALVLLGRKRDDWHLDIVGDGPEREGYQTLVAERGLSDRVTFHGLKSKEEVAEYMRRSDLFVLPSLWENLPCVLLEAMASGLPIVSTKTGGIPEIVTDEIGLLVPSGDSSRLSEALETMVEGLNKFDRLRIAHQARRYGPQKVGEQIDSYYRTCVQ